MRTLLLFLLPLLIVSCDGGTKSSESSIKGSEVNYEYYSGEFPPTIPSKTRSLYYRTLANKQDSIRVRIGVGPAIELHNTTLNLCKQRAREQGWEEYQLNMWKRELNNQ
ncbi:hypothetical protein KAR91_87015 [Candidatus Pacearchaeota archaeon]|nr:hypothetical protein [Candidatus Pacearchaeota archaeon]